MTPSSLNLQLALISSDRRTLDGLQRYFERLGARLNSTSNLEEASSSVSGADAVLLFADDYPGKNALSAVVGLSVKLVVVVTSEVALFRAAVAQASLGSKVVVVQRPAWGWMLLDAVRACVPAGAARA
jgi:hypothetical protein